MKMPVNVSVELPQMPNFLRCRAGQSIDDAHDIIRIDVCDVDTEAYLKEYAEAFRAHVEKRRKDREAQP